MGRKYYLFQMWLLNSMGGRKKNNIHQCILFKARVGTLVENSLIF